MAARSSCAEFDLDHGDAERPYRMVVGIARFTRDDDLVL